MHHLSDEELIAKYRAQANPTNDNPYINELFQRHHQRVALWCLRITGDRNSAADLAQEIFANAFRYLGSFQGASKFSTWLYSITRNHCLNELKSKANRLQESSEAVLEELPDQFGKTILEELERESAANLARQLIQDSLDETERQVFTLHYGEDMPLDAITRLLGLSNASGAKAYIVSSKRKLQHAVRRWRARNEPAR